MINVVSIVSSAVVFKVHNVIDIVHVYFKILTTDKMDFKGAENVGVVHIWWRCSITCPFTPLCFCWHSWFSIQHALLSLHHSPVLLCKMLVQSLTVSSPRRDLATIYSQLNRNKLAQVFSFRPNFSFVLAYLWALTTTRLSPDTQENVVSLCTIWAWAPQAPAVSIMQTWPQWLEETTGV